MKRIYLGILVLLTIILISCGKNEVKENIQTPQNTTPIVEISKAQKIQHTVAYYEMDADGNVLDIDANGNKITTHQYVSSPVVKFTLDLNNGTAKDISSTVVSVVDVEFNNYAKGLSSTGKESFRKNIRGVSSINSSGVQKGGKIQDTFSLLLWADKDENMTTEKFDEITKEMVNFDYKKYEGNKSDNFLKSTIGNINRINFFDTLVASYIKTLKVKMTFTYADGTKGEVVKTIVFDDTILKITQVNKLENSNYIKKDKIVSEWINGKTNELAVFSAENYELNYDFSSENLYLMFTDSNVSKNREDSSERIIVTEQGGNQTVPSILRNIKDFLKLNNKRIDIREKLNSKSVDLSNIIGNHAKVVKKLKNISRNSVAIATKKNDETIFKVDKTNNSINSGSDQVLAVTAKVLAVNIDGDRQVNIWVDKNKLSSITEADAQVLADKFLKVNDKEDIYTWITNVFGKEWVNKDETLDSQLIDGNGEINILVTDLNQTYDSNQVSSYTMGYFWNVNTFKIPNSNVTDFEKWVNTNGNEKNIFFVDATLYSKPDRKNEIYSTLAHEFVHMINWYQKDLLELGCVTSTETWLNEMFAMIGEDIVDNKLNVLGSKERAECFNYYNYLDVNDKDGEFDLYDYAPVAMYGSYLTRTYVKSDLSFIGDMMHNEYNGEEAIEYAISNAGYNESFLDTIKNFGKAAILSNDDSLIGKKYWFNKSKIIVNHNGILYEFEPINLFDSNLVGSYAFQLYGLNDTSVPLLKGGANMFYKLGENLQGTKKFTFVVPEGVQFEAIVKNADGSYNETKSKEIQGKIKVIIK